jgi:hypothetical protein
MGGEVMGRGPDVLARSLRDAEIVMTQVKEMLSSFSKVEDLRSAG